MVHAARSRQKANLQFAQRHKLAKRRKQHNDKMLVGIQTFGIPVCLQFYGNLHDFFLVEHFYYLSEDGNSRICCTFAHDFVSFVVSQLQNYKILGERLMSGPLFLWILHYTEVLSDSNNKK